jgi:hypothetical protein
MMTGRYLVFGAAMLPALSAAAMDQPRYDLKLERAAMDVIAAKIGDIRPGFGYGQRPVFVMLPERPSLEERAASWRILPSDPESRAVPNGSIWNAPDGAGPEARKPARVVRN